MNKVMPLQSHTIGCAYKPLYTNPVMITTYKGAKDFPLVSCKQLKQEMRNL